MIRPTSDASGTLAADRSRRLESKLQFDREAEQRGLGRLGARTQRPYNTDQTSRPFILMVMRLFRSLLLIPYNTSAIALTSVPAIIRRPSIANRPAVLPAGRTARMPRAQYEGDQAVRRKAMTARQRPHNFVTHRYEFVFVSHSRSPSVSVSGFGTISHFTISFLLPILSEHCFDQLILHEAVTTVRII